MTRKLVCPNIVVCLAVIASLILFIVHSSSVRAYSLENVYSSKY